MATVRQLTTDTKLLDSEDIDWKAYFENVENLNYKFVVKSGNTFLLTKNNEIININEIPNFYAVKKPTEIENLKEGEVFTINGIPFKLNDKYQKARFRNGFWLELAVQIALRKAGIEFCGNSMNENHYPHATADRHTDMETEYLLIECTSLTKWLGFEAMQEKIDYFLKTDPHHKKKWILITTWQKCIPKPIRQQILNYNITLLLTNQVANNKNHNQIAQLLVQPLTQLNEQAKQQALTKTTANLVSTAKPNLILTAKNRYVTTSNNTNNSLVPKEYVCVVNNNLKSSGLDG